MAGNNNLNKAKSAKKDEFYTQLSDIENELRHYREHFKGKTVLCNCDDPRVSNFFHYFSYNFEFLGLKKLITTCYKSQDMDLFSRNDCESAIWLEYFGDRNGDRVPSPEEIGIHKLKGDGDFRSPECVELLKEADIVVTNPPFSLFREYVAQLIEHDKKFIIVGHQNALKYKEIFPPIKDNKIWLGFGFKGGAGHFISNYEDVASAERKGSLDSKIANKKRNDIQSLVKANPSINKILFNGNKAYEESLDYGCVNVAMPSTSSANTHFTQEELFSKWLKEIKEN